MVWRDPQRFDPARGAVSSWLLTLVHHRAVDAVRREATRRKRTVRAEPRTSEEWNVPPGPGRRPGRARGRRGREGPRRPRPAAAPSSARRWPSPTSGVTPSGRWRASSASPLGTVKSRMFAGVRKLRDPAGPARRGTGGGPMSDRADPGHRRTTHDRARRGLGAARPRRRRRGGVRRATSATAASVRSPVAEADETLGVPRASPWPQSSPPPRPPPPAARRGRGEDGGRRGVPAPSTRSSRPQRRRRHRRRHAGRRREARPRPTRPHGRTTTTADVVPLRRRRRRVRAAGRRGRGGGRPRRRRWAGRGQPVAAQRARRRSRRRPARTPWSSTSCATPARPEWPTRRSPTRRAPWSGSSSTRGAGPARAHHRRSAPTAPTTSTCSGASPAARRPPWAPSTCRAGAPSVRSVPSRRRGAPRRGVRGVARARAHRARLADPIVASGQVGR